MVVGFALSVQIRKVYLITLAEPPARLQLSGSICHRHSVARRPTPANCQNVAAFDAAKTGDTVVDSPPRNDSDPTVMSKLHFPIQTLIAASLSSVLGVAAQAETLVDIYDLALENDAQLKAEVAQYNADIELEKLALAPLLPQAGAGYSLYRRRDGFHSAERDDRPEYGRFRSN